MKSTFKTLFYLKRNAIRKDGKMPIIARITVDGKISQFSTKLEINPQNWNVDSGKAIGRTQEIQQINTLLDEIKASVHKIYHEQQRRDSVVTSEKVKNEFLGMSQSQMGLLELFQKHNEDVFSLIGKSKSKRYHDIKISSGGVYYVLVRNGLNRLPKNQRKRSIKQFKRYEKQVPGHRIQVDVKFLNFLDNTEKEIKRYQYTAIDDATRARALKIYDKHTQANAVDFVNYFLAKFPFRVHIIQTDNGHEFQAKFHWHCEDLEIRHVFIKPRSPHLNGKVERSHLTDKTEFYQLIEYTDDIDIAKKLSEWETFYNCHRPNAALKGKTPYEVLKDKLSLNNNSFSNPPSKNSGGV